VQENDETDKTETFNDTVACPGCGYKLTVTVARGHGGRWHGIASPRRMTCPGCGAQVTCDVGQICDWMGPMLDQYEALAWLTLPDAP
jgi:hypothetical protein